MTGQWAWWRDGAKVVVGWMLPNSFADDIPICTVRDTRDAGLLVDLLSDLEAQPVGG
jgi:hypothetical protein